MISSHGTVTKNKAGIVGLENNRRVIILGRVASLRSYHLNRRSQLRSENRRFQAEEIGNAKVLRWKKIYHVKGKIRP